MVSRQEYIELSVSGTTCFGCVGTVKNGVFKQLPQILDATFTTHQSCTLKLRAGTNIENLLIKLNQNEFEFGFGFKKNLITDNSGQYFKRATYNALISVPLMFFNMLSLIPNPLTVIGQAIGVGLSIITLAFSKLCLMWFGTDRLFLIFGQLKLSEHERTNVIPKNIIITSKEVKGAIEDLVRQIIEEIKVILEKTPPELASDIKRKGIVLAGGGSLIRGLDQRVSESLGLEVFVAENPLNAVVGGIEKLLNDYSSYKTVLISPETDY